MNYFKYILSDKKGRPYWAFYYAALFMFSAIQLSVNWDQISFIDFEIRFNLLFVFYLFTLIIVLFAFPLYYSYSFYNYKIQVRFLKRCYNILNENSIRKVTVETTQSSYEFAGFRTNWKARINPEPTIGTFTIVVIGSDLIVLGLRYGFGVFREHLRPILINLGGENGMVGYKYVKIAKEYNFRIVENDLEIHFEKPMFDITMLKIKDWKLQPPSI